MVTEPQTIRDVWYMLKTSNHTWLNRTRVTEQENYSVGCVIDEEVYVEVPAKDSEVIYVRRYQNICMSYDPLAHVTGSRPEKVDERVFASIEDFKNSEYYKDFLGRYSDGMVDSSWFDDMSFEHKDGIAYIECELGLERESWLNKGWFKTSRRHSKMCMTIDQTNGIIEVNSYLGEMVFSLEELYDMILLKSQMEENNISFDGDKLVVRFEDEGKNA